MKTLFIAAFSFLFSALPFIAHSQFMSPIAMQLDSFEKELGFSGVVLISKGDSILLHKGYGKGNNIAPSITDKNTVYNIASITKAFTAVAILQLVESGKLTLQDSLVQYFSHVPETSRKITIHQLLSHHSGIPQTYAAEGEHHADQAAKKVLKVKLQSEPGSRFIYSNGNYSLLALLIEKFTGKTWEDHIKHHILLPLGMTQTYFWAEPNNTGLPEVKSEGKESKRKRDYGQLGSTGIFSTARDIQRFLKALHSDHLLNANSKAMITDKYAKLKSAFPNSIDYASYGLFQTEGSVNATWVRGNEEAWGVAIGYLLPTSNYYVIVLSDKEMLSNGHKQHQYVSSRIINSLK